MFGHGSTFKVRMSFKLTKLIISVRAGYEQQTSGYTYWKGGLGAKNLIALLLIKKIPR